MADASSQEIFMAMDYGKGSLVEGESLDDVHPGEIRILSLSLSASRSVDASAERPQRAGGLRRRQCHHEGEQGVGGAFGAAAKGSPFATVIFSFRKHGAAKTGPANGDYLQWGLQNAYITSFQHSHGGSDTAGVDSLSLVYDKIEIWYGQQEGQGAVDPDLSKGVARGAEQGTGRVEAPVQEQEGQNVTGRRRATEDHRPEAGRDSYGRQGIAGAGET